MLLPAIHGQAGPLYSDLVITQTNPVIYWNQDETTGTTAYDLATGVGGANNGTYTGLSGHSVTLAAVGPRPTDGLGTMAADNKAASVDGHELTLYNGLSTAAGIGTSAYSVQLWFNASQPFTNQTLEYLFTRANSMDEAGRRDAVYVGGSYTGSVPRKLSLVAGNNSSTVPAVRGNRELWENNWYHLTFVRDDSQPIKAKVYLNGKLEIQSAEPWWNGGIGNYLNLANRPDYPSFTGTGALGFTGRYDEAAVWSRALSPNEVWGLFASATGQPYYPTVVLSDTPEAYWRLNETNGNNTAADLTGHGHSFTYHSHAARSGVAPDVGPYPIPFGGFELANRAPTLDGIARNTNGQLPTDGFVGIASGVLAGTPGGTNNDYTAELWFRIADGATLEPFGAYLMHRADVTTSIDNVGDFLGLNKFVGGHTSLFSYNGGAAGNYGAAILDDNTWYHVAMVRQGDYATVYLNGEVYLPSHLLTSRPGTTWANGQWAFGGRSDMPGQQVFKGNIDEIAIYRGALDAGTIRAHYLAALVPEPAAWLIAVIGGIMVLGIWRRRRMTCPAPI
jgi:hypothetical protein